MTTEIGPLELGNNVLEFDTVRVNATVGTGTGTFERDHDIARTLNRRPAYLYISEEHHAVRSPVLQGVWKDIYIHEGAPGLPGAKMSEFAPGMTQAKSRLAGVHTRAEEFEFEDGFEISERRGSKCLHAEASLTHAPKGAASRTILPFEGR